MSNATVAPVPPSPSPAGNHPMITVVRDAHVSLMRQWREIRTPDEAAKLAAALRDQVQRAGCEISSPAERDEAQGILDYWISAVAALPDQQYPSYVALADYKGVVAARAGDDARKEYLALGSEEERRVARALFEDLLVKKSLGVERCGARTRAVLQDRLGGKKVDAILERFVASGAIAKRSGETLAQDLFEATDANLVKSWPELDEWLSTKSDYERKREILLNRAQRWADGGHSSIYLARGEDLRDIDGFRNETETLDAYITASQSGRKRFRRIAVAAACAGVLAFALLSWQSLRNSDARAKVASAEAAVAKAEAAKAKALLAEKEAKADATAAQAQRPAQETVLKAADAMPMPISTLRRLGLPTLEGAVWLGSDQIPQVTAPVWKGIATPPSKARAGTAYRVLADINLRDGMPSTVGEYVSRPQRAVVRAGTLLIVTGKTQAYDRPTGRQYWADVQVVPRIYVQYTGMEKTAVERLRTRLSEVGFDVPAAEQIASAKGKREIRYFDEKDRPVADLLLNRLNTGTGGSGAAPAGRYACRSFAGSRASNRFALEIWVDSGARPSGSTTCE